MVLPRKRFADVKTLRAVSLALRRFRDVTSLSQEQLAERLGVSQPTVARWESGDSVPRGGHLLALSRELGIPAAALVGDEAPAHSAAVPVQVAFRVGEGTPSGAALLIPESACILASSGDLVAVEIMDDSADLRFPAGSVLICERWSGSVQHRAIAVLSAHPSDSPNGLLRVGSAAAPQPQGVPRWWSLSSRPDLQGPLPTAGGELWTPVLRPVVAITPIPATD